MRVKVIMVGAGLAGLVCARLLLRAGVDVTVFEASDSVGGRVRSDLYEGYTLDRGFQVLFDSYPSAARNLDLTRLDLRAFDPGANICRDGRITVLTDPTRDRSLSDVASAALSDAASAPDKVRLLKLSAELRESDSGLDAGELTTREFLNRFGFSDAIVENFFVPFYGGIFLDRTLSTSAANFVHYQRMLTLGHAAVPALGMGQISRQLAEPLEADGRVRLSTPVAELIQTGSQVAGVKLESGEQVDADAVCLAVDAPAAARLAGIDVPSGALGTVTLYFQGQKPLSGSRKLYLNANADAFVNNVQILTNIAPEYAPARHHLISASVTGVPAVDDAAVFARAAADINRMLADDREATRAFAGYAPLRLYRIPYSQFPQPPGSHRRLPGNKTNHPGLYLAGEYTVSSSIDGAMTSGEQCAHVLLASAGSA